MSAPRTVTLLGSTGSIGVQALDVIDRRREAFAVVGLAAAGGDPAALAAQVLAHADTVQAVAVARATAAEDLTLALNAEASRRGWSAGSWRMPRVLAGPDAAATVAAEPADVVVNGITGTVGLAPTLAALRAGRTVALANKESLVAGGPLVRAALAAGGGALVPVDSEHSALAQCLRSGRSCEVRRLILTASGGPFRGRPADQLATVTVADALAHPTWVMGPVVTINSATLMNKGLETIEAHELFDLPYDVLEVVVHPESLIHSMVEFTDGSTLAQLSPPDMRLPIALALGWPDRVPDAAPGMDWTTAVNLHFEPLDSAAFPAVDLARQAGRDGGTAPAVLNAANEEAVAAFLAGALAFPRIVETVAQVLADHTAVVPRDLADVRAAEDWARRRAREVAGLNAKVGV